MTPTEKKQIPSFASIYKLSGEDERVVLDERAATLEYLANHSRVEAERLTAVEWLENQRLFAPIRQR